MYVLIGLVLVTKVQSQYKVASFSWHLANLELYYVY